MKKLFLAVSFLVTLQAFGFSDLKSDETYNYPDYYQVKEDPRFQNINLLVFVHVEQKFPTPEIPYNRDTQFGTWIRDTLDGTCMNTRGKVLVRDTKGNVTYNPNGCTVSKGDWDDPYSGKEFFSASDIQIDHFVPLKNAYMTGAYEWDASKRCLYANFMGNDFHLLAVSGKENLRKSDSTPSNYMPLAKDYACTYLKQWLEVKTIWALRLTPKEALAVKAKVAENNCDENEFLIPNQFIREQRTYMANHADLCQLHQ